MTAQTVATIKAAIVAKLVDGAGLTTIKKWFNSEPSPVKYTELFAFVEWAGGSITPEAAQKRVDDDFFVTIVLKSADSDANEDAIITLCKAAEDLLDVDATLAGTVLDSWVSNRQVQKYPAGDREITAVRLTVSTWRYKP
jgi:hypothetical protein